MKRLIKKSRKNEDGAVIVLVAILITILIMFTALAVDMGLAYFQRQRLQNACDAAALAAVTELPNETKARNRAYEYMLENGFSDSPSDVIVEFEGSPAERVRVTSTFNVDSTFAKIFGSNQIDVTCRAAAGKIARHESRRFPYLIFAEGGTLKMGADYSIDGAVHTNADLVTNPGDRTPGSYMKQMSYGTTYEVEGHPCIRIDDEDYWVMTLGGGDNKFYFNGQTSDNISNTYAINTRQAESQSLSTVQSWVTNGVVKDGHAVKMYRMSDAVEKDDDIILDRDYPTLVTKVQATIASLKTTGTSANNSVKNESSPWSAYTGDANSKTNSNDSTNTLIKSASTSVWVDSVNGKHTGNYAFKSTGSGNVAKVEGNTGTLEFDDVYFYAGSGVGDAYSGFTYSNGMKITTKNVYCNSNLKISSEAANKITINGNIYCDGNLFLKNVKVVGNIYATGNITTDTVDVVGLLSCKGDIKMEGQACKFKCTEDNGRVAVYSELGDILTAPQDNVELNLIGIMYAKEGDVAIKAKCEFWGNIIGKTVDASYKDIKGHPIYDLAEFPEDGVAEGAAAATRYDYVLVE